MLKTLLVCSFLLFFPFTSHAANSCNDDQLRMIAAGCSDSLSACAVRGINNVLAGHSSPQMILDMCKARGPIGRQEDDIQLASCVTDALNASSDEKLHMIAKNCAAKQISILGINTGMHGKKPENCNRAELLKLLPQVRASSAKSSS